MLDAGTRPILVEPDPILRRRSRLARVPDPRLDRLVAELFSTMRAARGLGLAAPQIGSDLRVAVAEVDGVSIVLINAEVVARQGRQMGWEGCLSVPHMVAEVLRPADVQIQGSDQQGRTVRFRQTGLAARVVMHELDHFDGRLYVDLVAPGALVDVREHPTPPSAQTATR